MNWLTRGTGGAGGGDAVRWAAPEDSACAVAAVYQIAYSPQTLTALEPGFLALDNLANRQADWREYHPIRSFLAAQPLREDLFYGFLSPKFRAKMAVGAPQVHAFAQQHADADVLLFSPFFDLQALFPNAFVQGEYFHPGLLATAQAFVDATGQPAGDLAALVTDDRVSVFCNYFLAKPRFWRRWLEVGEALRAAAGRAGALGRALRERTPYVPGQAVERKVFVMERLADLLLATEPGWTTAAYPQSTWSPVPPYRDKAAVAAEANALKAAWRDTGDRVHLDRYFALLQQHGIPWQR